MKKKLPLIILIIVIILLTILIVFKYNNNNGINTKGITLKYRVYTSNGWSKWYNNGQIAGTENKNVLAFEAKVESNKNGNILYNIYSTNDSFDDNNTYGSSTVGNKKNGIYGIKMFLSDDLFKNYQIYYRTHNKKDGWLDWTNNYSISGHNGIEFDLIQIEIIDINEKFKQKIEKASIGF